MLDLAITENSTLHLNSRLKGGAKSKCILTSSQVNKIMELYRKPNCPLKGDLLNTEGGETIIKPEVLSKWKKKSAELYAQWKDFVIDNYAKGNTCGVCLTCYSFLTRRKRVS